MKQEVIVDTTTDIDNNNNNKDKMVMQDTATRSTTTTTTTTTTQTNGGSMNNNLNNMNKDNAHKDARQHFHQHGKDKHKNETPETIVDTKTKKQDSGKRNIVRKNNKNRENGVHKKSHNNKNGMGGGGKKGQWNVIDDGTMDYDLDNDYDSADDDDDDFILVSEGVEALTVNGKPDLSKVHSYYDEELERIVIGPAMILSEFKRQVCDILNEYFESEDLEEVEDRISELNSPEYHYEFVKRAISLSLDRKERERELVSRLLSELYPRMITSEHIAKGFERLFEMQEDLLLDIPSASKDLEAFLVRAVIDEILPPKFLSDPFIAGLGGDIVICARNLLSREHVGAKIQRVWGPGDGRPVDELKIAIDQLLEEYLISQNLDEASNCVKELAVEQFHHELVKRAVTCALDKTDSDRTAMSSLLAYLVATEVVSEKQMSKGFDRLYGRIDDLCLDVPNAPKFLSAFVEQAQSDGCLPKDYTPKSVEQGE